MEFYLQTIGFGILAPGLISFACLFFGMRAASGRFLPFLGAVAFGAVLCCCVLLDLVPIRPSESWQWLAWLGAGACLVRALSPNQVVLWICYVALAILSTWLLVPDFERILPERSYWLAIVPFVLLISLISTTALANRLPGPALPLLLCLATVASSLLIFSAGLAKFAQLAGVVTCVVAGCWMASWFARGKPIFAAIAPGWALVYPGLLLEAKFWHYSETPLISFILLLGAPLAVWLTALSPVWKMKPIWRTALGVLLVAAPAAIGLLVQFRSLDIEEWG